MRRMKFSKIEDCELANGLLAGVSLYTQGCSNHCPGCFNPETWNFDGGKLWTPEIEAEFLEVIGKSYIKRVSILGGEPLDQSDEMSVLLDKIRDTKPDIIVWLFTGYTFESIKHNPILQKVDILVDGRYMEELRDLTLKHRGSSNQRVIDIKKTFEQNKIVLFEE